MSETARRCIRPFRHRPIPFRPQTIRARILVLSQTISDRLLVLLRTLSACRHKKASPARAAPDAQTSDPERLSPTYSLYLTEKDTLSFPAFGLRSSPEAGASPPKLQRQLFCLNHSFMVCKTLTSSSSFITYGTIAYR